MTAHDRRELMRLLSGELDAERAERLEARLRQEPILRRELARWSAVWQALDPAPDLPVPAHLATGIVARYRRETGGPASMRWSSAPLWVRAAAAAALALGIVAGVATGNRAIPVGWDEVPGFEPTLAETLWRSLGDGDIVAGEAALEVEP